MDTEKTKRTEESARPNAGTNVPNHKLNPAGEGQAEEYRFRTDNKVSDANEDIGAAKECLDVQLGRGTPDGGKLGNSTTQPQSGCGEQ
jgi:hypothetical protein